MSTATAERIRLEDGTLDPAHVHGGDEVRVLLSTGRSFIARVLEVTGDDGFGPLFVEVPVNGFAEAWVPRVIGDDDWVGLVTADGH